jgi:hypothetical protein
MQTADSIGQPIAQAFILVGGLIVAYDSNGDATGISNPVPTVNGLLSFNVPSEGVEIAPNDEYCELVSPKLD